MKTLYLMRHGQTLFNQTKKIQGWCDSPLTDEGIQQAQRARHYFKENNIHFDSAYSSTSERASDTLEMITDIPYQRIKGLKEWNFGTYEGESETRNPALPYRDFFVKVGGEDEFDFQKRISDTILSIMQNETNQHILMVSHGAACRQFMRKWESTSQVDQSSKIGNCCILTFIFENDQFELVEIINP